MLRDINSKLKKEGSHFGIFNIKTSLFISGNEYLNIIACKAGVKLRKLIDDELGNFKFLIYLYNFQTDVPTIFCYRININNFSSGALSFVPDRTDSGQSQTDLHRIQVY